MPGSETAGAKLRRQKGNSLQVEAQWERLSACIDNQEVGSEAAILERVRNSSLVECAGAENVTGLKPHTEAVEFSSFGLDW